MTEQQAEKLATLLLGAVVTAGTYYILRTPPLRRAAWQFARTALGAAGPWLVAEARTAWAQSARANGSSGHAADPTGGT